MLRTSSAVLAALMLAACSSSAPPPAAPKTPQKTVIDAQLRDLQKAREVQQTLDQAAHKTDREVEKQSGGS